MTRHDPALLYGRHAGVASITFNRPSVLNAVDEEMAWLFRDTCMSISRDPDVRVIVLRGVGRGFMAGADLAVLDREPAAAVKLIDAIHDGIRMLCALSSPVIASVHGVVAGTGLGLALACDLAVAAEGSQFTMGCLKTGSSCDAGASWFLPRAVGVRKAMEIALLDHVIDAYDAQRLGLIHWVVPKAELEKRTDELALRLVAQPPVAMGHMKRLLLSSYSCSLQEQLAMERKAFLECSGTVDFAESVRGFFEMRASRT